MSESLQWQGTSLRIPRSDRYANTLDALQGEGIDLREEASHDILENQNDYFIYENEYLAQSANINTNIVKYSQKNYETRLKVYSEIDGPFSYVGAESKDREKYLQILSDNVLRGDHLAINISPNILNEILDQSNQSRVFLDILLLLFLANKCEYDAETIQAEFKADESSYRVSLNITQPNPIHLYPLYDWIINDEEFNNSFEVKLQIVRQVVATRKSVSNVDELLKDCRLSFKRIISRKTNDYFDQLNKLKDDYLVISKSEGSALRTVNLTFFSWLGFIGIELFNIISKYDKEDIWVYLLFSGGAKKGIVISLFIIALVALFIAYVSEINALKKTYIEIKKIYKDKILFDANTEKSKFDRMIPVPKVGTIQKIVFSLLIIALSCRLLITFPW